MTRIASKTRLAAALMGVAVAMAFPVGASAGASTGIYVNPSTGFASNQSEKATDPGYVNPSTGFPGSAEGTDSGTTPVTPIALSAPDESSSGGGFDWPSAAIGAATSAGLLLLVLAATAGMSRRGRPA
jgi:hypothetical protein